MSDIRVESLSSQDVERTAATREEIMEAASRAYDEATSSGMPMEAYVIIATAKPDASDEAGGSFQAFGSQNEVYALLRDGIQVLSHSMRN